MKKKLKAVLLTTLLTLTPLAGKAAGPVETIHDLKHLEIELHVGPSFALGGIGNPLFSSYTITETPVESVKTGAMTMKYDGAKVGINYGLSLGYYVTPNWGFVAVFNGHSLGQERVGFSPYKFEDYDWTCDSKGRWVEFMAMAGATYRCMIAPRLIFSARASIGYAHLKSPYYTAVASSSSIYTHTFKVTSSKNHNFGYGAGAALSFAAARGFHLHLRAEYMGALPFNYKDIEGTYTRESVSSAQGTPKVLNYSCDFKALYNVINVSFGLSFCL